MIFQVDYFRVNPVTGITEIDMTWNSGKGVFSVSSSFDDEQQARNYIIDSARSAILFRFERYVNAVKNMSDYDTTYYHTAGKTESIKTLWRIIPGMIPMEFDRVCKNINHHRDKLTGILPGEKHLRYKMLYKDAMEILEFAKANCDPVIENFMIQYAA